MEVGTIEIDEKRGGFPSQRDEHRLSTVLKTFVALSNQTCLAGIALPIGSIGDDELGQMFRKIGREENSEAT